MIHCNSPSNKYESHTILGTLICTTLFMLDTFPWIQSYYQGTSQTNIIYIWKRFWKHTRCAYISTHKCIQCHKNRSCVCMTLARNIRMIDGYKMVYYAMAQKSSRELISKVPKI